MEQYTLISTQHYKELINESETKQMELLCLYDGKIKQLNRRIKELETEKALLKILISIKDVNHMANDIKTHKPWWRFW